MPEMYVNELSSSNLFMKRNKYLELGGMDENLILEKILIYIIE